MAKNEAPIIMTERLICSLLLSYSISNIFCEKKGIYLKHYLM